MGYFWWFDDRDGFWHAWLGTQPTDGDVSACTHVSFDSNHDSQSGHSDSKGRCDACRRAMAR